ncbi:hypothetical protein cand_017020 [Cryptosporidium andersoni]|uniref:Uncharacterized protein n=1 Tax=Cryptosporidium andersoni TaxID=117008 RepID=A0A1J4MTP7_9CRYT|nr:hypothetical protein cand_017020 [Cryptosporidium andersoni]
MEDSETTIVDFISTIASVIKYAKEEDFYKDERSTKELGDAQFFENLMRLVQRCCKLNQLFSINNDVQQYSDIMNSIPNIHEIRSILTNNYHDEDDLEILINFFKSIIKLCDSNNIVFLLESGNEKIANNNIDSPEIYLNPIIRQHSRNMSIFPNYLIRIFNNIRSCLSNPNIRYIIFFISKYAIDTLVNTNWECFNISSWFSRPVLADFLMMISCDYEETINEETLLSSHFSNICPNCYAKGIVINVIFQKILSETLLLYKDYMQPINISFWQKIDNIVLCFGIIIRLINMYHPQCYLHQLNKAEDQIFYNWWITKTNLGKHLFNTDRIYDNQYTNVINMVKNFYNQIDSAHMKLKKSTNKNQFMNNFSTIQSSYGEFSGDALFGRVKIDLPISILSTLNHLNK